MTGRDTSMRFTWTCALFLAAGCNPPEGSVIVVGGGISGLSAAFYLLDHRGDIKVTVLEKQDRVGGRAISGTRKGMHYAQGTEYLGKPVGALRYMVRQLDLEEEEIGAPMDAAYVNGGFHWGEEGLIKEWVAQSSVGTYNRFVDAVLDDSRAYDDVPWFDLDSDLAALDDITTGEWVDDNGFPAFYGERLNVASRGLFGANIHEISALSYVPELAFEVQGMPKLSREDVNEMVNSPKETDESTESYTFRGGINAVTEAVSRDLGKRVKLQSTVTAVTETRRGWKVSYTDPDGEHSQTADVVILAVPAPVALQLAEFEPKRRSLLEQISFSPYATITLFSDEPLFEKAFDLAVPDGYSFTDIYDSTWVQRGYSKKAENSDVNIVGLYLSADTSDDRSLLDMSDEELLAAVFADWREIFADAPTKHIVRDPEPLVTDYEIVRFEHAYPVMTTGAYHRLANLYELNDDSLLVAGDQLMYPTFEAAAEVGELVADQAVQVLRGR